jgi:site-specific recombinase XerD
MGDLTVIDNQALTAVAGGLDQNPAAVYLAGLAPRSRRTMGGGLTVIARLITGDDAADYLSIPWQALRFQHTAAIRSQLAERYAHTTANRMLSALRGVLRAAWKLGLMGADDFHTAASVGTVRGETVPAGRHVPVGEISALLGTCDQTAGGIRDAAIISLLYAGGLRRAELVGLDLADYDQAAGTLRVSGKGGKVRLVPVVNGAAAALADWLTVRGAAPGALFLGTGNRQRGRRLTTQAIYNLIAARAAAAGIKPVSPHDMRRTFVGELLDRGADISTVQKLAGHASVTTTARYDRRGEATKRKAAELLHVPYTRRTLASE